MRARVVADVDVGFWLGYRLVGRAGLREAGMSRATLYRRLAAFRRATGSHPDAWELPGVQVDAGAFWAAVDE